MVILEAVVQQEDVNVIWYKNDVPLETSKLHEIIQKGDVHQLILRGMSAPAEFKIKAINGAGESSSSCLVSVRMKAKPKVSILQLLRILSMFYICMNDIRIRYLDSFMLDKFETLLLVLWNSSFEENRVCSKLGVDKRIISVDSTKKVYTIMALLEVGIIF